MERPGWSGSPSARATVTGTSSGSVIGARSTYHTPSPNSPASWAATWIASRVLPTPPAPVNVTTRFSASSSRSSVSSRVAAHETGQLHRKTCGHNGFRYAQRRELVDQVGMAQLHHPLRAGQITQRVGAQIGQPHTVGEPVDHQLLGRARQHRLAAVGQIAQPRGAVDRRAGVVTLIAQLHLAGVHPDAQPDRGQRRPLQLQRSRHRIGGAGERRHEAVALALLDRAHPVMGGDDIRHRPGSDARSRRSSRSGWVSHSRVEPSTSANSSVTVPVGKSPLTPRSLQSTSGASARGSISLMLASMRPPRAAKHQRKRVEPGLTTRILPRSSLGLFILFRSVSRLGCTRFGSPGILGCHSSVGDYPSMPQTGRNHLRWESSGAHEMCE